MTGFTGAVEENLRGEAGRAAQSEKPQILGVVGDACGADSVRPVPAKSSARAVSVRAAVNTARTSRAAASGAAATSCPFRKPVEER